jgi:hypothetical protein
LAALPEIRKLIFEGKYTEAAKLATEKIRRKCDGIKGKGRFEINELVWKDGRIVRLSIRSLLGGNCRIKIPADTLLSSLHQL